VKCGGNDAVNELGTVHVLVVICRLSDWLNKTESNRSPCARSSPESFASFIKTIPAFEPISDWRSKKSLQYRASSMPCIMLKTCVCILMNNGVEVFWQVCCISAVCMDQYAWSTRLLLWFLLSYDGSFAREWINTLLNIPALISAPDHLRLLSLPVVIDASGAQKRWCACLSLTPDIHVLGTWYR
jgi:hypothetical protein